MSQDSKPTSCGQTKRYYEDKSKSYEFEAMNFSLWEEG